MFRITSEDILNVFLVYLVLFGESVIKQRLNPSPYFTEIFLECFVDTLNVFIPLVANNIPVNLDGNNYIGRAQEEIGRELCWYHTMISHINGFWRSVGTRMVEELSEEMHIHLRDAVKQALVERVQKMLPKHYAHCYYRHTYSDELTKDIKIDIQKQVKALIG